MDSDDLERSAPHADEQAHTAYVVVTEDKTPILVVEVNGGERTFELSPRAAGELRSAFIDGPQVRHDLEGNE